MQKLRLLGGNLNGFTRLTYQFSIYSAYRMHRFQNNNFKLHSISHSCQKDIAAGWHPETITFLILFCISFISFVYFGENNNSNVLKSLNIGYVITYNTVFSICSQYVEFYKVFPRKVSDKANGTFMS